jgi:hypothetical protein
MYVLLAQHLAMTVDCYHVGQTQLTIDTLPDDALLCIFDFYVARTSTYFPVTQAPTYFHVTQASDVEAWHTLVHVCSRWRNLVFGSPRRLNLRIACTIETPVREKLDIWPPLPIVILGDFSRDRPTDHDNIKAALEHHNRVCQIKLSFVVWLPIYLVPSLEEPFPILTDLDLSTDFEPFDPDPTKFLGGGPAQLRSLHLKVNALVNAPIPDLPNLLLSTPNLVVLSVDEVSYDPFLPDELVNALSALISLKYLILRFSFGPTHPNSENRLPTRTVLPSLTMLEIKGKTEGLEDFMARIDAPLLCSLDIRIYFDIFAVRDIVLDTMTPQLFRFISRLPKLQPPVEAQIGIGTGPYIIFFFPGPFHYLQLEFHCGDPGRQFTCLAQFCRSAPFPIHPLKSLGIYGGQFPPLPRYYEYYHRWLEILGQFPGAKNLYLSKEFAPYIARALQALVGERVMEVLPILESISIEEFQPSGPVHKVIEEFVAARQLAGHPITISRFDYNSQ